MTRQGSKAESLLMEELLMSAWAIVIRACVQVLPQEAAKGQEGQWSDLGCQRGQAPFPERAEYYRT
jgi:hypothetical protein